MKDAIDQIAADADMFCMQWGRTDAPGLFKADIVTTRKLMESQKLRYRG
jgi:hypothetical protein